MLGLLEVAFQPTCRARTGYKSEKCEVSQHLNAALITHVGLAPPLGGPGLVVLGVVNSLMPLPGSADVLTIWLRAHQRDL